MHMCWQHFSCLDISWGRGYTSECCSVLVRLGVESCHGEGIVSGSWQQFYVSFISLPVFQNGILYTIVSFQLILLFCRLNRLGCQYALLQGSTKITEELELYFKKVLIHTIQITLYHLKFCFQLQKLNKSFHSFRDIEELFIVLTPMISWVISHTCMQLLYKNCSGSNFSKQVSRPAPLSFSLLWKCCFT